MADEKPLNERVSILESRMDSVDKKFDDNQSLLYKFFDRFDSHIVDEQEADMKIQIALTKVSDELTTTNKTLAEIKIQGDLTTKNVAQVHTVWKTVVVIISILCTLAGAGWAYYQSNKVQLVEFVK